MYARNKPNAADVRFCILYTQFVKINKMFHLIIDILYKI